MAKTNEADNAKANLILVGTEIKGDIICTSGIRIDGKLKGTLNSEARLVIGESGSIEGNVVCGSAIISGTLHGKITVKETLSLKSTAHLKGDIITNKLAVEPGAVFTGNCSMGGVVKGIEHGGKRADKAEEKTA